MGADRFANNPSTFDHANAGQSVSAVAGIESPIQGPSTGKRLALFADKLSSGGGAIARAPAQLLPSRSGSHSRGDSQTTRDAAASPAPLMTSVSTSKSHTSPSKTSARTYDSNLVSREMHRLGNFAHLPTSLGPSPGASASTLTLPSNGMPASSLSAVMSGDNPWGSLHVLVLPLFNSEPLRVPIEDLNTLVKRHIQTVVSNSPPKAVATLESETSDLIASGMDTFNGKLAGVGDDKLVGRVVELWGFFWDQVLPYVEGVLLPLQTDELLLTLYRTPKSHRASSPSRQNGKGSMSMSNYNPLSTSQIDVRTLALRSFRDKIILPIFPRLHARINTQKQENFTEGHTYPRLQQMLLVLVSQGRRQPASLSLTSRVPQPPPGESAVNHLLRLVRAPGHGTRVSNMSNRMQHQARTLSFLSGNIPRDRRGRIGHRPGPLDLDEHRAVEDDGQATPRTTAGRINREREREILNSLRSPDLPQDQAGEGGWGLGAWNEDGKDKEEDDEDEQWNWDQAQAAVERLVGMKPVNDSPARPEGGRRRMT
ncbi:HbrB-like-domain-containing protein [Amylostereum chailletii]|nr:HbrB-like-domain-containing protein [Amylostereum chailletii]